MNTKFIQNALSKNGFNDSFDITKELNFNDEKEDSLDHHAKIQPSSFFRKHFWNNETPKGNIGLK